MTFGDLESLKQYLKKDSETVSLNPVRFINVDSLAMWIEAKKILIPLVDETINLSTFCEGYDTTPNISRISSVLRHTDKSQLVTPLSEYLRIIPEQAEIIIQKFIQADYQNNDDGKLRIIFLMYRMKDLLRSLPLYDSRAKDCIIMLDTCEESDYRLTIIQKELNIRIPGNEIDGFKRYLEYWESTPDKPLILYTSNAIHFEKNHFFDDVHVIVSSYELIKYQFGLPLDITEDLGIVDYWNQLVKEWGENVSFENTCCKILSTNKYSSLLYKNWNKYNDFEKWILWLWTRLQSDNSYEVECAKNSDSVKQFVDVIYCRIISFLHDKKFDVLYQTRKIILEYMETVPTEHFWNEVSSLETIDSLACLTCLSDIERKTVFEIIAGFDYQRSNVVLPILKYVYPQLYNYLQNENQPNAANLSPFHKAYFDEYKWLKATNTITGTFIEKVKNIALAKGSSVFEMQPRNYYINLYYDNQTLILFVDGMGVEYIDYIAHMLSDLNEQQYQVTFEAGSCVLPSITEINKDFMIGKNTAEPPMRELDSYKHANNAYPDSLISQLNILNGLKSRVLSLFNSNIHKVIIASDHGTSRLAVKVRGTEFDNVFSPPSNTPIYKYGRFCYGTQDEQNYPTAISINDRLIFADYSRFKQKGAPIDEIHGGASLEEWIVPIIIVEKLENSNKENIVILPQKTTYRPDLGTKQIKVVFSVSGEQQRNLTARINGNSYNCTYEDGNYCFTFIPEKSVDKLAVRVVERGVILGKFDIQIEQGIKGNSNFNI